MKKLVSLLLAAAMLALVVPVFTGCFFQKMPVKRLQLGQNSQPS